MTMTMSLGYGELERITVTLDEAEIKDACLAYIRHYKKKYPTIQLCLPTAEVYEQDTGDDKYAVVYTGVWEVVNMKKEEGDDNQT